MSAMQRAKGRAYEQEIARRLRAAFPSADVRRSSQADRAANSDVVVTGSPVLERLWLELQDAREPTPRAKLAQAERDLARETRIASSGVRRDLPVVIWHRIRERTHQVTTRLWVLDELRGAAFTLAASGEALTDDDLERRMFRGYGGATMVTLDLGDFVEILRATGSSS